MSVSTLEITVKPSGSAGGAGGQVQEAKSVRDSVGWVRATAVLSWCADSQARIWVAGSGAEPPVNVRTATSNEMTAAGPSDDGPESD
jgi:hypothetical protein